MINVRKVQLPKQQIKASFAPASLNEANRTVDVIFTTGAKGLRFLPTYGKVYEELSLKKSDVDMSVLGTGRGKLLANHDLSSNDGVIGVVESASLTPTEGRATVRFSTDEISDRNFQKVKDGILTDVSIGYSVTEFTDISGKGDPVPTFLATKWRPYEISIVPIGFDSGATVRNEENNLTEATIVAQEKEQVSQNENEENKTESKSGQKAERERITGITRAVRAAKLDSTIADEMIERGVSMADASAEIFAKLEAESKVTATRMINPLEIGDGMDHRRAAFVDSMASRIDDCVKPTEKSRMFAGMDMVRAVEQLYGRRLGETNLQLITRSLTTSDFGYLLADSMNKAAQARYQLAPRSFEKWVSRDSIRNYKSATRVRAGDTASLLEVKESGEYHYSSFGQERETVQLKRYGRLIKFSVESIVNDDLGILQQVASETALSSARLENDLSYSALTSNPTMGDSVALFHASHGNLGTPGAPSETTFSEALKLMRKQMSVDGTDPLNIAPKFVICGPDTEVAIRKLLAQIAPTQSSSVNIFSSMGLELVVDAKITDGSYFFAADPAVIKTVVLYNLDGQPGPTITSTRDWKTSGLEIKTEHTAAAAPQDWRGLVKNAGA